MVRCCVVDVVITTSVQSMGSKDWNGVTLGGSEGGVGTSAVRLGWMGLLVVLMVVVLLVVVVVVVV